MMAVEERAPRPRLRVLPSETPRVDPRVQDCSRCRLQPACWDTSLTGRQVNLLVCRLQRGIAPNQTTRALLQLFKKKVNSMLRILKGRGVEHFDALRAEAESTIIVRLMTEYEIGDVVSPSVWLFHPKYGNFRHWVFKRYHEETTRARRFTRFPAARASGEHGDVLEPDWVSYVAAPPRRGGVSTAASEVAAPAADVLTQLARLAQDEVTALDHVRALLAQPATLSTQEYRVLHFHLRFGFRRAAGVPSSQQWLAQRMCRARQDVTNIFNLAVAKIAARVEPTAYLPSSADAYREFVLTRPAPVVAARLSTTVRRVYQLRRRFRE